MIRKVSLQDAREIHRIYSYYIEHSTATLELEPISVSEMESRIRHITETEQLPFHVWEEDGSILGYAYATTWRKRAGYMYSVESSIYLDPDKKQKGIGTLLYQQVIDDLKKKGLKNVIGVLTLPNDESVAFHEKMGFIRAGYFEKVGFKFGEMKDVGFWQLTL